MSKSKKSPISPVRAIFHDALPAPSRDLTPWLGQSSLPGQGSSLPPQTAAALLHASKVSGQSESESQLLLDLVESTTRINAPILEAPADSAFPPVLESGVLESGDLAAATFVGDKMGELRDAVRRLKNAERAFLDEMSPQLLRLTRMIAERVLCTEALSDPELPLRLVHEAMMSLHHGGQIAILLGTGFARFADELQTSLEQDGIVCEVQVLRHLSPYACQVKANFGAVDQSLETRLDQALKNVLGRDQTQ